MHVCKHNKVVFVFSLEAWSVCNGKYKTEIYLGEVQERREKKSEKSKAIWFCLLNRHAPVSVYCGNSLDLWLPGIMKFSFHWILMSNSIYFLLHW